MADPLADLIAMARRVTLQFLYIRSPFVESGQMYVMAPTLTGAPANVYVIPTGDQGDQILAAADAVGWTCEPWEPTPEQTTAAFPEFEMRYAWAPPTSPRRPFPLLELMTGA